MALISPFGLGTAGDVWKLNQQDLLNRQRQQQINDMLANDALKRHLMQQQVTAGGQGFLALANMPQDGATQAPPIASNVAPAPAPGQSSQPKPPQSVDVPGASNIAQFAGNGQFANITTPQQAQIAVDKGFITPQAGLQIVADMNRRGTLQQQFNKGSYPASAPQPWAPGSAPAAASAPQGGAQAPMQAPTGPSAAPQSGGAPTLPPGLDQGTIGRSLALAQSNLPVNQLARFVQNYKRMYPNASAGDVYFAVQQVNPTLVNQANGAAKIAGMTIDSLMKSLTTFAQITNAQTRQAELPSQIARNDAMANYYKLAAGQPGAVQGSPLPAMGQPQDFSLGLAALNGSLGSTGGPAGIGRQRQAFAQLNAMGLTPAAEKPYQNDLMVARQAATQLQSRASLLDATAQALETQLPEVVQLAKSAGLTGPVFYNGTVLKIGGKIVPTTSPIYQKFQKYDALRRDVSRELGAQQMFGKASVSGLKSAEDLVAGNKGVGLEGVLEGMRDGAKASIAALDHVRTAVQIGPTLRLIAQSTKPEVAAQAFGFKTINTAQLKAYAKANGINEDQAAMALATNPTDKYFVIGYRYGQ